jgi:hypothetical protein
MIRYPNIIGKTDAQKLEQMKSYLHQLTDELNFHLDKAGSAGSNASGYPSTTNEAAKVAKKTDTASIFNDIKALIIKSADIINAYYDEINARLEGVYVSESDFGIYAEQTTQDITANSKSIEQFYTDLQQVISDIEGVESTQIEVNAHINSGLLYYAEDGTPVYGLEIGQKTEVDGQEVFNKFARFTADKLSFYDQNGNEVAYISDRKLYITHIEVIGSFSQGGFVDTTLADGSIVTRWMRGDS